MSPKETLIAARARIEHGWCQNAFARDAAGTETAPKSEQAVSWCALGALIAVSANIGQELAAWELLRKQFCASRHRVIPAWNDDPTRTKAEVLALFDAAIAEEPTP